MTQDKVEKYPSIDVLKGIGALIIAFIFHYKHFGQTSPFANLFLFSDNYGYLLVDLFFILSGFGIAAGYQHKIQNKECSFSFYIKRRFTKLYPPHFFTLIYVTILQILIFSECDSFFIYKNNDISHFFMNLLCIQNGLLGTEYSFNGPAWYLSICTFCYIFFFFIFFHTTNTKALIYRCILTILIGGFFIVVPSLPIINSQMGRGITGFALGIIIFNFRNCKYINRISNISLAVLILGYIILRLNWEKFSDTPIFLLQYISSFIIAPLIAICCFNKLANKICNKKTLLFFGKISLGIYLWHFPIQCTLKYLDDTFSLNIQYSSTEAWLLYVALTIGIAYLYHGFSNKIIKSNLIPPKK